ncbi:MAG: TonB-dependent receptor [Nonlabens sp.]
MTFNHSAFAKAVTLLLVLFSSILLNAQTLKGIVLNENNKPLKDAYILIEKTGDHTHSDDYGMFELNNVATGTILKISHIGYEATTITVKNLDERITIVLKNSALDLETVVISNEVNTLQTLARVDLAINPVTSSQEILQSVPGLFIGQHAGGGKAEQIFLRGFDIDHGTDIAINVDGMPVNMVSHAHGQGYADLHFVIPETVDNVEFGKGSYDETVGNFATAGHVNFSTKNYLQENRIGVEVGDFNHKRLLGLVQLLDEISTNAYIATEYLSFDGPFDSPQNFDRLNLFGKLNHTTTSGNVLNLSLSHFDSEWDASGQIPQRAVDRGLISRFGAIDDTEGGTTSRTSLNLNYRQKLSEKERLQTNLYYSHYDFLLFSNFTFFLEDPINGDQIRQQESRDLMGLNSEYSQNFKIWGNDLKFTAGLGLRNDRTDDSELSRTLNRRTTLESIQLGDINETNYSMFTGAQWFVDKFLIEGGLRFEYFDFKYKDALAQTYDTQSQNASALLPKLNIGYQWNDNFNLYLKNGVGIHSNDTRVVLENSADEILPKSYGSDLGAIWKPSRRLIIDYAIWYLFLEQEFVYVGDAGIVEPSGQTERYGLDLGIRYQLNDYLFLDANANYAHARSLDAPDGEDRIPLAPEWTSTGGISIKDWNGFNAGLRYRYIDDRPANEDNSIVADGYFVTDFNANYDLTDNLRLGVVVQNLFDIEWNETQFATESRLLTEAEPTEEIHFTPGTPFFIRGTLQYRF